ARAREEKDPDAGRAPPGPATAGGHGLSLSQPEKTRLFARGGGGAAVPAPSFPPVNVWEEDDKVVLEAELPGLQLKDLEIFVTGGNQLTLKGERRPEGPEKGIRHRQDRGHATLH